MRVSTWKAGPRSSSIASAEVRSGAGGSDIACPLSSERPLFPFPGQVRRRSALPLPEPLRLDDLDVGTQAVTEDVSVELPAFLAEDDEVQPDDEEERQHLIAAE